MRRRRVIFVPLICITPHCGRKTYDPPWCYGHRSDHTKDLGDRVMFCPQPGW